MAFFMSESPDAGELRSALPLRYRLIQRATIMKTRASSLQVWGELRSRTILKMPTLQGGGDRLFENELIINHSKDWQIWRYEIKHGNPHAHFKTKSALDKFMNLIEDGIMPTSLHYIVSAKRLFSDEELSCFKEERHKEQRYHNKIKKLRKQRRVYKYR